MEHDQFSKGGYRKFPFAKGDLEGFSSARHDFDVTLRLAQRSLQSATLCDTRSLIYCDLSQPD
jgi:hypothetical protein